MMTNENISTPIRKNTNSSEWLNVFQMMKLFGLSRRSIKIRIKRLGAHNLRTKEIKSKYGYITTHYSPASVKLIRFASSTLALGQAPPAGWMTVSMIAKKYGCKNTQVVRQRIDRLSTAKTLVTKEYCVPLGRPGIFYSPQSVEIIHAALGELAEARPAPPGWLTISRIVAELDVGYEAVKKAVNRLSDAETKRCKTKHGYVATHYSPNAIAEIKELLADLLKTDQAPKGWKTTTQLTQHFKVGRLRLNKIIKDLEDSGEIKDISRHYKHKTGQLMLFYSPKTVRRIARILNSLKPPANP